MRRQVLIADARTEVSVCQNARLSELKEGLLQSKGVRRARICAATEAGVDTYEHGQSAYVFLDCVSARLTIDRVAFGEVLVQRLDTGVNLLCHAGLLGDLSMAAVTFRIDLSDCLQSSWGMNLKDDLLSNSSHAGDVERFSIQLDPSLLNERVKLLPRPQSVFLMRRRE